MPNKGPCREWLLESIKPGMKLTKDFFRRVYGYEISRPGFAETALSKLETAGCSHAREYYADWVDAYEREYNAMLRSVAAWYAGQNFYGKGADGLRKRRETGKQDRRKDWETLSRMLGYRLIGTER